jgi:hypothetical protein
LIKKAELLSVTINRCKFFFNASDQNIIIRII